VEKFTHKIEFMMAGITGDNRGLFRLLNRAIIKEEIKNNLSEI
jgi:hypothetical protein